MENLEVTLNRDCKATLIPAGHEVLLTEGTTVHIAQTLGGNLTVRNDMGMYRIGSADLDALGDEFAEQFNSQKVTNDVSDRSFSEDSIWEALKTCYDPEIPVNIVDLGLIYDLSTEALASGSSSVKVKMTLTAQGCGMGPAIAADAKDKIWKWRHKRVLPSRSYRKSSALSITLPWSVAFPTIRSVITEQLC